MELSTDNPDNDEFVKDAMPSVSTTNWALVTLRRDNDESVPNDSTAVPSVSVLELNTDKPVKELPDNDALPSVKRTN